MTNIHSETIEKRWPSFSLAEQMSHIGSEVGRLITWRNRRNFPLAEASAKRASELIEATAMDPRWRGKEEEFQSLKKTVESLAKEESVVDSLSINKYFLPFFALAARV